MTRALAVAAILLVAAVLAAVALTGSEDESYRVRAIFDNAGFVIPGEEVRIAGVKVGSVEAVEVTPDFKAAVVLDIEDEGYQDFRADARCRVRPQSLIGERFVECEPTQRRGAGAEAPGALRQIEAGAGEGEYLLPVDRTETTVDLDLINNVMREPYRERLSIILNELGTGLAGRGADLDAVIRRANPALRELDQVLQLLARQNKQLEALAVDGDRIMAPLARERTRVSGAIENISTVAAATASRRAALEASFARLPRFLRELRLTMADLGTLAEEMTPVVSDLGAAAPDLNRIIEGLGPFSQAGIPALASLGEAGESGIPDLQASLPVIKDTRALAKSLAPVAPTLAGLLASFQRNDGIERAMDFLLYGVAATNGFDALGHYLRAGLIVNQCTSYATRPVPGCTANFRPVGTSSAAATGQVPVAATATPAPRAASAAAQPRPAGDEAEPLLDYLFGSDG